MANVLKTTKTKNAFMQAIKDHNGGQIPEFITNVFASNPPQTFGLQHKSRRSRYGNKW